MGLVNFWNSQNEEIQGVTCFYTCRKINHICLLNKFDP